MSFFVAMGWRLRWQIFVVEEHVVVLQVEKAQTVLTYGPVAAYGFDVRIAVLDGDAVLTKDCSCQPPSRQTG